jgi:hypothetical protein
MKGLRLFCRAGTSSGAAAKIVWLQIVGFTALIALSWTDEALSARTNWREAFGETVASVAVGVVVLFWTLRFTRRLYYLEKFPRVCAWCKRVKCFEDEWVSLEKFFKEKFHAATTHGICPACARQELTGHDHLIERRAFEILRELEFKSERGDRTLAGREARTEKA